MKRDSHQNPLFAWKIILVSFLVGFISFAIFGANLFFKVQNEDFQKDSTNTITNIVGIKVNQLKKVIFYINEKETRFNAALNSKDKIIDPSL